MRASLSERAAAELLWRARRDTRQAPPEGLAGLDDVEAAYRVQALNVARRVGDGARRTGRKIGLTSAAVRRQLGVDQPSYGVLFADMDVSGEAPIPLAGLAQPRIEAEIAFCLDRDVPPQVTVGQIAAYVAHALVAAEIVDSAIADWRVGLVEHVADNGSAALYALSPTPVPLDRFDPAKASMRMRRNGEPCSEGHGAACMDGPLNALCWLAQAAGRRGDGLKAGEVVLSGALGPIAPVAAGDVFQIAIDDLAPLDVRFEGRRT